jgi:hypothetical protein
MVQRANVSPVDLVRLGAGMVIAQRLQAPHYLTEMELGCLKASRIVAS